MSLGWPVTVGVHPGWTGHPNTSWFRKGQSADIDESEGMSYQFSSLTSTSLSSISRKKNWKGKSDKNCIVTVQLENATVI